MCAASAQECRFARWYLFDAEIRGTTLFECVPYHESEVKKCLRINPAANQNQRNLFGPQASSGASGDSLHGGASFKIEKAHYAA